MAITCSTDLAVLSRVAERRQGPFTGTPILWTSGEKGQIADTLLDHIGPRTIVQADKACDAERIRELIRSRYAPNMPPRSKRRWKSCFSKRLCRERNLIGRCFSGLKHVRRVATRYHTLAANFLAMVHLASLRPWLRAYGSTA